MIGPSGLVDPAKPEIPPPDAPPMLDAELYTTVLLAISRMPTFQIPPPAVEAKSVPLPLVELPLIVQLFIVMDPRLLAPPPTPKPPQVPKESCIKYELPLMVELVIVSEPPE